MGNSTHKLEIFRGLVKFRSNQSKIMWDFMHMRDEVRGLQFSVVVTLSFLIAYLAFILLVEGNYIFDVMYEGFVSWNF